MLSRFQVRYAILRRYQTLISAGAGRGRKQRNAVLFQSLYGGTRDSLIGEDHQMNNGHRQSAQQDFFIFVAILFEKMYSIYCS